MGLKQDLEQNFQQVAARISRLGPHPSYLNELGGIFYDLGMLAEAHKMFETAVRRDKSFVVAADNLKAIKTEIANQTAPGLIPRLMRRLAPVQSTHPLIRVGPPGDGGYLLPDDLEGIEFCFSPGVGPSSSFEAALEAFGIHSFLADASVDGPATKLNNYTFDKLFLGEDGKPDEISMSTWMNQRLPPGYEGDLLLQIDIEGAEYPVLQSIPPDQLSRFRIIVVELHFLSRLRDRERFRIMSATFEKLLEQFYVVHLHPNNCCGSKILDGIEVPLVMEATFLRKDRTASNGYVKSLPHPLDSDCVPGNPTLPLSPDLLGI